MKKIFYVLLALIFLSGCALSTIRPPKKRVEKRPEPVKKTVVEKVKEVFKPQPEPEPEPVVIEEKEEILPPEEEIK